MLKKSLRDRLADIYERVCPNDLRVRNGTKEESKKAYKEFEPQYNLLEDKNNAAWVAASAVAYEEHQDIKAAFGMGSFDGTVESYRSAYLKAEVELNAVKD